MPHRENADVVIHIDEALAPEQSRSLAETFLQREGVMAADVNPNNRHLMVIKYNPEAITSRDLVNIPRFNGLHCELVGL